MCTHFKSDASTLASMKRFLIRQTKPYGLQQPILEQLSVYNMIVEMIQRVISSGESNSILLTGHRGSGKSSITDRAIQKCSNEHADLLVVRLNGIIHTDDKSAIKDMARQLLLENVLNDKVYGSVEECLSLLLASLRSGDQGNKPIVMVLDEFNLFCTHKNQTLLYNLFDCVQSASAPMVVIGLTARLDAPEMLEKRVKSRFSHRVANVHMKFDFDQYMAIARNILELPEDFKPNQIRQDWKKLVEEFFSEPSVSRALRILFEYDRNIRTLKLALSSVVRSISTNQPLLKEERLEEFCLSYIQDNKLIYIRGLSVLEICLTVAMLRLTNIYDGEPVNFEMIYREYAKFAREKGQMVQLFDKAIVIKAFEHLMDIRIVEFMQANMNVQPQYRLSRLHLMANQLQKALEGNSLPTEVQRWASSALNF